MPPKSRKPAEVTYIVRFVEVGTVRVRALQAREQTELFMRLKAERGGDVRSWAGVSTVDQLLPEYVFAAEQGTFDTPA